MKRSNSCPRTKKSRFQQRVIVSHSNSKKIPIHLRNKTSRISQQFPLGNGRIATGENKKQSCLPLAAWYRLCKLFWTSLISDPTKCSKTIFQHHLKANLHISFVMVFFCDCHFFGRNILIWEKCFDVSFSVWRKSTVLQHQVHQMFSGAEGLTMYILASSMLKPTIDNVMDSAHGVCNFSCHFTFSCKNI